MLRPGDKIEYLADVSSPPNQKGIRGQTKIIDREIPMWTARFLLRGGLIRLFDPASPLQLEEEETKKGPDGPAEAAGPASTKVKKERRTTNGQRTSSRGTGESHVEANQIRDHGIKSPKRRGPDRGG